MKREPVPWIDTKYIDGECVKTTETFYNGKFLKYFCDMDGTMKYWYEDSSCSKLILAEIYFYPNCDKIDGEFKK